MKTAFAFLFLCSVAVSSAQACTETASRRASPAASDAIDLQSSGGGGGDINQRFRMSDVSGGESGGPDSTDYSQRSVTPHSPSNDEINAAERGSPDSVDSRF